MRQFNDYIEPTRVRKCEPSHVGANQSRDAGKPIPIGPLSAHFADTQGCWPFLCCAQAFARQITELAKDTDSFVPCKRRRSLIELDPRVDMSHGSWVKKSEKKSSHQRGVQSQLITILEQQLFSNYLTGPRN